MSRPRRSPPLDALRRALLGAPRLRVLVVAALALLAIVSSGPASAQGPTAAAAPADARAPSSLARLFPREADIFFEGSEGLVYVQLPLDVLQESRPDLSDVRVFNADGGEVPFLINTTLPRLPYGAVERAPATPIEVRQVRRRAEDGYTRKRERFVVEMPEAPAKTGAWDLVLSTSIPHFVRRAEVREVGEKGRVITTASVFRLLSPLRERMRIALPAELTGRIEVALESEDGETTYLEPALAFEAALRPPSLATAVVPLAEIERSRAEGRTIVTLARPRGLVPNALRFETSTRTFYRAIEVTDDGAGRSGGRLASAPVFRVETMPSVQELTIPMSGAKGDRLRVEIVDGDSPELAGLRVFAVVERPSLIASLTPDFRKAAATLRFGGGRAYRPSYDLEGFREAMERGEVARLADHLRLPREVPAARVGEIRANPAFDPSPALSFAMRAAAEIDLGAYSHRLDLRVAEAPEGVSRARLSPEVLAVARADLGDLRIVDAENRQWPYLVEEGAAKQALPLGVEPPQRRDGKSRYALRMPASPLFIEALTFDIRTDYLERDFRITGKSEDGRDQTLVAGHFARRPGESRAFVVPLPKARILSVELTVEDGDDAPIDLRGVLASVSVPDLFLVAPAGSYTLLAGQAAASVPRYELAMARELVISVSAPPATLGALQANPKHAPKAAPGSTVDSYALWAVLALAVVVLGALTLRLAQSEGRASAPPRPGAEAPPAAETKAAQEEAPKVAQEEAPKTEAKEQAPPSSKETTPAGDPPAG